MNYGKYIEVDFGTEETRMMNDVKEVLTDLLNLMKNEKMRYLEAESGEFFNDDEVEASIALLDGLMCGRNLKLTE